MLAAPGTGTVIPALGPFPFLLQLLRKGVAIFKAVHVAPCAGITVPVPGAANVATGLVDPRREAKFAQFVEHVEAGEPGPDNDRVEDYWRRGFALEHCFMDSPEESLPTI